MTVQFFYCIEGPFSQAGKSANVELQEKGAYGGQIW